MKKKILLFISAVMLASVCAVLPVFAASATVSVNDVSAYRGDTVTMSATLAKGVSVGSGGIALTYDKTVLELVGGEWKVSGTMLATFDTSACKGAFAYGGASQISGKIFTATFKVKSNAAFGEYDVKMTVQLKDGSNADISMTNNSGTVTVTCKHSYSGWSSVSTSKHERICSVCKNKETKNHTFTNACDTSCNGCGYKRSITHDYQSSWTSDSSRHWHECSVCKDKKDAAAHTPGAPATETTAQTCTVCGYVIASALGHTHKPTDTWITDADGHWHGCSTCDDKLDEAPHNYDSDCDEECSDCAYKRTVAHAYSQEWSSDGEGHWHICTLCGARETAAAHIPGAQATEEAPQLCTVCQYEIAPKIPHVHTFDDGKVVKDPTASDIGEKDYTCTACGYVKKAELIMVEKEVVVTTPSDPDTEPSAADRPAGDFSVVSMLIGIAIGASIGVCVMLIVGKRKG